MNVACRKVFLLLSLVPVLALLGQTKPGPATLVSAPTALTGTIKSRDPVTKLVAVDRLWADVLKVSGENPKDEYVYPGAVDAKTGVFSVPKLLPGRTYDLIVWTEGAGGTVRWEGVGMDFHRQVLPDKAVTEEDKAALKEFVEKTSVGKDADGKDTSFYDRGRILWMAADHRHATVLVELVRDRQFHSGASGEVIYRTELWYFENLFGGWAKDKNTERVITRVRGRDAMRGNWVYVPQLGGLTLTGEGKPVVVELPEKPDPRRGVVGGLK